VTFWKKAVWQRSLCASQQLPRCRIAIYPNRTRGNDSHAPRTARRFGIVRYAPAFTQHSFRSRSGEQLFNSSEKRLARILSLLADSGKESRAKTVLPTINQEHLAQMVGTTRSRVSHFMMKFKKLGFIDYSNGLTVRSGLLSVVLHD
jgi:CRP-like cAMP-binding protein